MFCENCGTKIPEGDKFCMKCGAKVTQVSNAEPVQMPTYEMPAQPENTVPVQNNTNNNATQTPQPRKKKPVALIVILAVLLVAGLIIGAIFIIKPFGKNKKQKTNTIEFKMEYIDISFTGKDSKGVAKVELNDEFKKDALAAMGFDEKEADSDEAKKALMDLMFEMEIDVDKKNNLSNEDKVSITISADEEALKDLGVDFETITTTVVVMGLTETDSTNPTKINPFDDLVITTYGFDGDVSVSWEYIGDLEYIDLYTFECNDWELSIGDKFTIYIGEAQQKYLLDEYNVELERTEVTYTVKDADKCITKIDDIDKDIMDEIKKSCQEQVENGCESFELDFTIGEIKYYGSYLIIEKGYKNPSVVLYMIYECTATSTTDAFEPVTVYIPASVYDLMENSDGTQVYDEEIIVDYDVSYVDDDNWVYGYIDEKTMFIDLYNAEYYDLDISGKLKDFSDEIASEEDSDEEETDEEETDEDSEDSDEEETDEEETDEEETDEEEFEHFIDEE